MANVTIIDSRKVPSRDPARTGKFERVLTWQLDGNKAFTFVSIVPDESATEAAIAAAIKRDAEDRAKHLALKITI